jgi:hypothetical protein
LWRILRTCALASLLIGLAALALESRFPGFVLLHGPPVNTAITPAQNPTWLCWLTDEDGIVTLVVVEQTSATGESWEVFFSVHPLPIAVLCGILPLIALIVGISRAVIPTQQRRIAGGGFPVILSNPARPPDSTESLL